MRFASVESGILPVDGGTETPTTTSTTTLPTTDEVEEGIEAVEVEPPLVAAADVDSLEHDPGLRRSILFFDVNEQDSIRRRYILKAHVIFMPMSIHSEKSMGKNAVLVFFGFKSTRGLNIM